LKKKTFRKESQQRRISGFPEKKSSERNIQKDNFEKKIKNFKGGSTTPATKLL